MTEQPPRDEPPERPVLPYQNRARALGSRRDLGCAIASIVIPLLCLAGLALLLYGLCGSMWSGRF